MPWPWAIIERAELDRLKAEVARLRRDNANLQEMLASKQMHLEQEAHRAQIAEHNLLALRMVVEVKER